MIKKQVSFSTYGQQTQVGAMEIVRLLPNRYADAVGHFVLLDHIIPMKHDTSEPLQTAGIGAHPHRGIATLTYLLNGQAEHFDSAGNHHKVQSGGVQWMNSGNGIIHDEILSIDAETDDLMTHGFQFWINLTPQEKSKSPSYMAIQAKDVPRVELPENKGWIKPILGHYQSRTSPIPNVGKQFLYHVHLNAAKSYAIELNDTIECGCFLPSHRVQINNQLFDKGEFIELDHEYGIIELTNIETAAIDILVFGGPGYTDPIIAHGPFVMNSDAEIATAYRDYMGGKYGQINYPNKV